MGAAIACAQALRRAHAQLLRALNAVDPKLSGADLLVLPSLLHGQPTPGDLGQELGLTSGSVTALIGRLEDAGLVAKQSDATDARITRLFVPPESRGTVIELLQAAHGPVTKLMQGLDTSQLHALTNLLDQLADPR